MRAFTIAPPSIWHNDVLSARAKILLVYLHTSPHSNYIGCYRCSAAQLSEELGLSAKAVRGAFEELSAQGLAEHFGNYVLVRGFLKLNRIENPSVATSRMGEFLSLPEVPAKAACAKELLAHYDGWQGEPLATLTAYTQGDTLPHTVGVTKGDTVGVTKGDTVGVIEESREKRVIPPYAPPAGGQAEGQAPPEPASTPPEPPPAAGHAAAAAPKPRSRSQPRPPAAQLAAELPIPQAINSPKFRELWAKWLAVRLQCKSPKRPWEQFFTEQLAWLAGPQIGSEAAACEALAQSLRNGWEGLFAPKSGGPGAAARYQQPPAPIFK